MRGVKFIAVPDGYYTDLEARLTTSPVNLIENFDKVNFLCTECCFAEDFFSCENFILD